jgi:hypothetical protein
MGKRLVIGLLAAGGVSALCCVGSLVAVALSDDEGPRSRATQAGQGFSVTVPEGFSTPRPGHWTAERREGPNRLWLDVQQLAPLHVSGAVDEPLRALWARSLEGYEGPADPLIQRRFVSNGARAHFARATVKRTGNPDPVMVSLYLVEADDALVPLFLVQGCDTNEPGALMIIQYSFPTTHTLVEAFLGGVAGSPVGAPLVDEAELTGTWTFADTGTLQGRRR